MCCRTQKQGEELTVARQMMCEAEKSLGKSTPRLWPLDALYFNEETITIAREQHAHILIKFKDPGFREVTNDAQNLFDHFGGDEDANGWDGNRTCWRFAIRKTVATFACAPVQVIELREFYPKRKQE